MKYVTQSMYQRISDAVRQIQEQEDAEFIKSVDAAFNSRKIEDFRFQSWLQFQTPEERLISVTEKQLEKEDGYVVYGQISELAKAGAFYLKQKLRVESIARQVLPPIQIGESKKAKS